MNLTEWIKQKIKFIIVGVFLVLVIIIVALGYSYRHEAREAVRDYIVGQETISEIENMSRLISEHEKYYYPKLDSKLNDIDNSIDNINKKLYDIKNVPKEDIADEIKQISINDLSNRFRIDGYNNTITESR